MDMELAKLRHLLLQHPADVATWEAALADNVHMRIGSASPVLGKPAVLPCLADLLGNVEEFDGRMGQFWKIREALLAETELHWRGPSGKIRIVPCFLVVRARGELIEDLRFYCDLWTLLDVQRLRAWLRGTTDNGTSADTR